MALITPQRAIELLPSFNSADLQVMTDIVNAASGTIEKYCNRAFAVTSYDELVDGTGHPNILLSAYPLVSVDRLTFNPTQVLSIGNAKTSVSRASFRLDATSLYLECVDDGTLIQHTISRASCAKFSDIASAVNAFSSEGWTATALGMYSNWRTADLYAPQGGQEVRWTGYGYLWHHAFGVPASMSNPELGEVVSSFGFQRGYRNYRAFYRAGFATIPAEIQQACGELAALMYGARDVNGNLQSESLGGYSYTIAGEKSFANLSVSSKTAIEQYRNVRVNKFRAY